MPIPNPIQAFSSFIENYIEENNLNNKALLLADNAPVHPPLMQDVSTTLHAEINDVILAHRWSMSLMI